MRKVPARRICKECGKQHRSRQGIHKCRKCRSLEGSHGQTPRGYLWLRLPPSDPMAAMRDSIGRVVEHRLVMARHLNRPLLSTEVVHHRNHNLTDNSLENLQLMTQSRHAKLHRREQKRRKVEQQLRAVHIPRTRANIERMAALMRLLKCRKKRPSPRSHPPFTAPSIRYKLLKPRMKTVNAPLPEPPESECRSGGFVL